MRTLDLWYTGGRAFENCVEIYRRMFKDCGDNEDLWDVQGRTLRH